MALLLKTRNLFTVKYLIPGKVVLKNSFSTNLNKDTSHFLKCRVPRFTMPKRTLLRFFKKPSIHQYKQIDNIPDHYGLIYRNTMERYVYMSHLGTFAVATIITLLVIIKSDILTSEMNFEGFKEKPRSTANEMIFYVVSVIALAVFVQGLVAKFPLRIYKVPKMKRYVFILSGTIPNTRRQLVCQIGQVRYIGGEGIVPWKENLYQIENKQNVILVDNFFKRPADLYIMLGEQKDPEDDE